MSVEIKSTWKYRQSETLYEVMDIVNRECENPLYKETVVFRNCDSNKVLALPTKKFTGALQKAGDAPDRCTCGIPWTYTEIIYWGVAICAAATVIILSLIGAISLIDQ